MARFEGLACLFFIIFGVTFSNGAVDSAEDWLDELDLSPIKTQFPLDVNLTQISIAARTIHPLASLNTMEIVEYYGYHAEVHTVKTDDDYILEIHRMRGNTSDSNVDGKPVVFLQHGLLCSSVDWVLAGPGRALAFLLVDAGYDVWMGNARGSRFSRRHESMTVADADYWNFDWHQIGIKDLPKMIDFVLGMTGQEKLFYVGHSQGSTSFFVMATELPEYNNKIKAMFSLAPVAYCSRMFSPVFQTLALMLKPINLLTNLIGAYEFKPSDAFYRKFINLLCGENSIVQPICMNVMFLITGFDSDQLDIDLLPAVISHIPAGAATNQFVHYGQIIRSGQFRQFDYGFAGNLKKYLRFTPPKYNLKNVKAPVSLHYSVNDWLSDPVDVDKLYRQLPNPIGKFRVPHDKFNHLDYLFAKDAKTILYDKIMSLMKRYGD